MIVNLVNEIDQLTYSMGDLILRIEFTETLPEIGIHMDLGVGTSIGRVDGVYVVPIMVIDRRGHKSIYMIHLSLLHEDNASLELLEARDKIYGRVGDFYFRVRPLALGGAMFIQVNNLAKIIGNIIGDTLIPIVFEQSKSYSSSYLSPILRNTQQKISLNDLRLSLRAVKGGIEFSATHYYLGRGARYSYYGVRDLYVASTEKIEMLLNYYKIRDEEFANLLKFAKSFLESFPELLASSILAVKLISMSNLEK